jgi:hypothetical protein
MHWSRLIDIVGRHVVVAAEADDQLGDDRHSSEEDEEQCGRPDDGRDPRVQPILRQVEPALSGEQVAHLDQPHGIAFCPGAPERHIYAAAAPDGLAGALGRGEVPGLLERVPVEGTGLAVYRARP